MILLVARCRTVVSCRVVALSHCHTCRSCHNAVALSYCRTFTMPTTSDYVQEAVPPKLLVKEPVTAAGVRAVRARHSHRLPHTHGPTVGTCSQHSMLSSSAHPRLPLALLLPLATHTHTTHTYTAPASERDPVSVSG